MSSFEEALEKGGALVGAWDDVNDTRDTLSLFAIGEAGAKLAGSATVPPDKHEDIDESLRARGLRIGHTYSDNEFVWVADEQGLSVWSATGLRAEGNLATLRLKSGAMPVRDVKRVIAFCDPKDRGRRGVRLAMADGSQPVLVEEHDRTVAEDPAYDQDDLAFEAAWAAYLARDIASWIGIPLEDQIAHVDNADDLRIRAIAHAFADELARLPETGTFEHVLRSIGTVPPAGELAFRYAPNPLETSRRFLELRVNSPSNLTTSGRWIKQGTNEQVAAFLRRARTPALVVRTMNDLLRAQKQDSYA